MQYHLLFMILQYYSTLLNFFCTFSVILIKPFLVSNNHSKSRIQHIWHLMVEYSTSPQDQMTGKQLATDGWYIFYDSLLCWKSCYLKSSEATLLLLGMLALGLGLRLSHIRPIMVAISSTFSPKCRTKFIILEFCNFVHFTQNKLVGHQTIDVFQFYTTHSARAKDEKEVEHKKHC